MVPHFYLHPGTYAYDFGPQHPLKPERLHRMMDLLGHYTGDFLASCETASDEDLLRVHSEEYLDGVREVDQAAAEGRLGEDEILELRSLYGFWGDNPPFPGMDASARAYTGASVAAALAVQEGAPLAFGLGGGLHHALRAKASGFCIYNDCAVACSILRERWDRVAYVDIDVHHGDGVQWIFYEDPTILSCSIHESGKSLWPGTGGTDETGGDGAEFSSLNVPVEAGTTGDVWLWAFRNGILPVLDTWQPQAIVLQVGADTHYKDPLAHVKSTQQHWLAAVMHVQRLGLPTVVLGGGGYNMTTVPRMWTSSVLSLCGIEFADEIPANLQSRVGAETYSDHIRFDRSAGQTHAEHVIEELQSLRYD